MSGLIKPLRFRFLAAEDIDRYGNRWWTYDESQWTQLPARRLMLLEQQIGAPLVDVMNGIRVSSTFGDMAAAWLAMALDPDTSVGSYESFNPRTMMMEWEAAPEVAEDSAPKEELLPVAEDPEEWQERQQRIMAANQSLRDARVFLDQSTPEPLAADGSPAPISQTDTVSLPNMPVAGSNTY